MTNNKINNNGNNNSGNSNILVNFYREYFKPRFFYVERYLDNLDFSHKMSKKDKEIVKQLEKDALVELKAVKKFHIISIFLYIAIYFSFINLLFSEFYLIGEVVSSLREIIAFVGPPVFLAAQFIVTRFRNIRFDKLSLYASHLISYSTKK